MLYSLLGDFPDTDWKIQKAVKEIAEIKGINVETAERVIYNNTIKVFNLPIEEDEVPDNEDLA